MRSAGNGIELVYWKGEWEMMTNGEIIDVLDDITWNGCGRYEKEVMIECRSAAISALKENNKLKAEIEQLKSESEQLSRQYINVESLYHKYYNLCKKSKVSE